MSAKDSLILSAPDLRRLGRYGLLLHVPTFSCINIAILHFDSVP